MTDENGSRGREVPLLSVEDVSRRFGSVVALDGVSLSVEEPAVVGIVGPNGSGKTTLLRIVAGLLAPTSGHVERVDAERSLGYLPQRPAFRPAFTVGETLSFYADLLPAAVDVEAALERVGLSALAERRVEALSGGMTRLLGLAAATLGDPPLVVLDEPTGDLDPRMTEHIFETVDGLPDDDMAVLMATHDLTGASGTDQLLVLDRGSVRARGTPDDVVAEADAASLPAAFRDLVEGETELTVRSGVDR